MKYLQRRPRTCIKEMLPRFDKREIIRQDEDGEWICPKGEEVLSNGGSADDRRVCTFRGGERRS
jgi:hypothetical protein